MGFITLADEIRISGSHSDTRSSNIKSLLLTGDNKGSRKSCSGFLGMDGFLAEVLLHEKAEQDQGTSATGELRCHDR